MSSSDGVSRIKVDLHVHTPASRDFNSEPLSADDAYIEILDEAKREDIRVVAITDHNTFKGYNHVRELLRNNVYASKYADMLILCGIEITCFSKHLLAIFPDDFSENNQTSFLRDIGIDEATQGSEEALADNLGPSLLIAKIGDYNGIALLAHADSNKGFLQNLCNRSSNEGELSFKGKSLAKILKSKYLYGLQCNSTANALVLKGKLDNVDFKRHNGSLAFIKCSDCHGIFHNGTYIGKSGHRLGEFYSVIKLSEISYEALKMALLDPEMRICEETSEHQYPYVVGTAIKSKILKGTDDFALFHFNPELNCIIGSRGTGKTTLLEIIQSIIMPNSLDSETYKNACQKYSSSIVYVKDGTSIYAISNEPQRHSDSYTEEITYTSDIKIYIKKANSAKFQTYQLSQQSQFFKRFLAAGYQQRQLFDYSRNPDRILEIVDNFISWKDNDQYARITGQIKHMTTQLNILLNKVKKDRSIQGTKFIDYIQEKELVDEIIRRITIINQGKRQLQKLRKAMIIELNEVMAGKVHLALTSNINDTKWKDSISVFSLNVRYAYNLNYEYYVKIDKCLEKAYYISTIIGEFNFFALLLKREYDEIIDLYKMKISPSDLENIRNQINEDFIPTFVDDGLKMKYNINAGTSYEENFKDNAQISMGQNAVALLLLILNAAYNMDDNRPLLMDQPEDDLDNSYIYSTLVKEFRKSKVKRQVIISTHNPNIPVAADAESILVLKFNGQNGYLSNIGAIDSKSVAADVLEIMEGGSEAIKKRTEKYSARYGHTL